MMMASSPQRPHRPAPRLADALGSDRPSSEPMLEPDSLRQSSSECTFEYARKQHERQVRKRSPRKLAAAEPKRELWPKRATSGPEPGSEQALPPRSATGPEAAAEEAAAAARTPEILVSAAPSILADAEPPAALRHAASEDDPDLVLL